MSARDVSYLFSDAVSGLGVRLGREIASSSRRKVFSGEGPTGDTIAVKVALSADEAAISQLTTEYLVGAGISHPNMLGVTACGVAAGLPFLLLEYMPSTVEELISGGSVDERLAVNIVAQAGWGVATLHELSLAHGDVKPSNLLYDPETGAVKVCDFGSIEGLGPLTASRGRHDRSMTPAFASPERTLDDEAATPQSDVYSLGLVLLQLLTGRHPLDDLSISGIVAAHKRGLTWDFTGLSPAISAVLGKCLERQPGDRFRSAGELSMELDRLSSGRAPSQLASHQRSQETLQENDLISLAQLSDPGGRRLAAASLALFESMRNAAGSAHMRSAGQCAVTFQLMYIDERSESPGDCSVSVFENHTGVDCQSSPRSFDVAIGDRRNQSEVRMFRVAEEKRRTWRRRSRAIILSPRKRVMNYLVGAAMALTAIALITNEMWPGVPDSAGSEMATPGDGAASPAGTLSLQVSAAGGWTDTGYTVNAHETLVIEASGRVETTDQPFSTPDGADDDGAAPAAADLLPGGQWLAPELPAHSLIGRIGDGLPFFVGWHSEVSAPNSGPLYLAVNSAGPLPGESAGAWSVTVSGKPGADAVQPASSPKLFLYQGPETGIITVNGPVERQEGGRYALFDLMTRERVGLIDVDEAEYRLQGGAPGETMCYFARTLTDSGYGPATRSACATTNTPGALRIDNVVELPGHGASRSVTVSADGLEVYAARGQTISRLTAETLELQQSVNVRGDTRSVIADLAVEPATGRVMYVHENVDGSHIGVLSAGLEPIKLIEDPDIDFERVIALEESPGLIFAIGAQGWLIIDSVTLETKSRVFQGQDSMRSLEISADGRYVFSHSGPASEGRVYSFDSMTGEELGSFRADGAISGVYFTTVGGEDRLLSLTEASTASEGAYVLTVPELDLVEAIDRPDMSWVAEPVDGDYLVATQSHSLGETRPAVLSLVQLRKDRLGSWETVGEIELVAGHGAEGSHIAASHFEERFFVPSPATGQLFAVSAN